VFRELAQDACSRSFAIHVGQSPAHAGLPEHSWENFSRGDRSTGLYKRQRSSNVRVLA
jgi:hypothetical protein